jgi:hypothetical protein
MVIKIHNREKIKRGRSFTIEDKIYETFEIIASNMDSSCSKIIRRLIIKFNKENEGKYGKIE